MNIQARVVPTVQVEEGVDLFIRAQLAAFGLRWLGQVSWNEAVWRLVQNSAARGEARLSATGALVVETGIHTGRSPKDKFVVRDGLTAETVDWHNNLAMTPENFEALKTDMLQHARLKDLFVQDLEACPGAVQRLPVRVVTETAWAALFMRHLL